MIQGHRTQFTCWDESCARPSPCAVIKEAAVTATPGIITARHCLPGCGIQPADGFMHQVLWWGRLGVGQEVEPGSHQEALHHGAPLHMHAGKILIIGTHACWCTQGQLCHKPIKNCVSIMHYNGQSHIKLKQNVGATTTATYVAALQELSP